MIGLIPVIVLLVLGVGIPYAVLVSERSTQRVFIDRTGDATRFATLVDAAVEASDYTRLDAELSEYAALYGSSVWVIGLDGLVLHDPGLALPEDAVFVGQVRRAFAGGRVSEAPTVFPRTAGPLRVVEPVGRDSQVTAVVVIEASTAKLRANSLSQWTIGLLVLLVPVAGLIAGLWPLTRWIMRPVRELERRAVQVRAGDLGARADVDRGPPELRELSASFNTMVGTVERSMERQRAFVSDAAHQLRNPLASLRLSVENLGPWLRDGDAREAHDDAIAETVELGRTFESMLGAASREPIPDEHAWTVGRVYEVAIPHWEIMTRDVGMALVVDGPHLPDSVIRQPPGGLVAVLDELVSNAARLSGGTTVAVRSSLEDSWCVIEVVDDGVGLTSDEIDSATGRFWRAPRHQNVDGTGLGLAIVTDVVADAGGTVELRQASPTGLVATVRLPQV
ncbi:Signal transduction histidine kinase [Rhodococcoides kyotonense]|uniref:histidine kinase n=2 Tax=Rhodococcoides kyotonense TaxID=398843 RepID=A0A239EE25_9NOCA|nr:Signal transduction histidine kinase [Rhodococcus kyotonensis]